MPTVTENLRYMLWNREVKQEHWANQLADWARCATQRAEELLQGARPEPEELEQIAQRVNVSEEELQFARLVDEVHILGKNIRYLLDSLDRGEQKDLAENVGVSEGTISKWHQEKQKPSATNLRKLRAEFGLPSEIDLNSYPLFLSMSPIGERQQKEWLREHIERLNADTLRSLFPALERLLREP